jgi:hypothetical protein
LENVTFATLEKDERLPIPNSSEVFVVNGSFVGCEIAGEE